MEMAKMTGRRSTSGGGRRRELKVKKLLEQQGWWVIRAAGSLGNADLVALKLSEKPLFVEVKTSHRGPFHGFGPARRHALADAALRAGATATICYWPAGRSLPRWVDWIEWPDAS